jgi:hypothetical protein
MPHQAGTRRAAWAMPRMAGAHGTQQHRGGGGMSCLATGQMRLEGLKTLFAMTAAPAQLPPRVFG